MTEIQTIATALAAQGISLRPIGADDMAAASTAVRM